MFEGILSNRSDKHSDNDGIEEAKNTSDNSDSDETSE